MRLLACLCPCCGPGLFGHVAGATVGEMREVSRTSLGHLRMTAVTGSVAALGVEGLEGAVHILAAGLGILMALAAGNVVASAPFLVVTGATGHASVGVVVEGHVEQGRDAGLQDNGILHALTDFMNRVYRAVLGLGSCVGGLHCHCQTKSQCCQQEKNPFHFPSP